MKTGDKKQAAILGVVAVGAVLFLGNSVFSTFGGNSQTASPKAVAVKNDAPVKQPETVKTVSSGSEEKAANQTVPIELYRDSFLAPELKPIPVVQKLKPREKNSPRPLEVGKFAPLDPGIPNIESENPSGQKSKPVENTGSNRSSKKEGPELTKTLEIRYEGFVEASSPMAIISIDGKQITVDPGEKIAGSIEVLSVLDDRIVITVKGVRKTVWLGKGVTI